MPPRTRSPIDELPPPTLVEDPAGFEELLGVLERETEIAVDTEADSFFHYREKVCLIQVTAGGRDYLLDPLAGLDLDPFGQVLADPRRTKVFHDGEYDVLILKRDYGFSFAGLFDTRVASAALGCANPGLASVLKEHFDVELDKSQQRSDWSRRPLSEKQVAYARLDTHFLISLMHLLVPQLEERGRLDVVAGECRRVEALEPPERVFNPDEFIRLKGARALSPGQMQALRELFRLRERLAEERDVPPFKVLGNDALVAAARAQPRSPRELGRVAGFPQRLVRPLADAVVGAVSEARRLGPLKRAPRLPSRDGTSELSDDELELHERLKAWRKGRAVAEELDASLVLNRHLLLGLARERPTDPDALQRLDGLQDWQIERYGEQLVELVSEFEADLAAGRVPPPASRRQSQGGRRRRQSGSRG